MSPEQNCGTPSKLDTAFLLEEGEFLLTPVQDGVRCAVCLEPLPACRTDCGHQFHEACIEEWLDRDSRCPLCRKQLRVLYHCAMCGCDSKTRLCSACDPPSPEYLDDSYSPTESPY